MPIVFHNEMGFIIQKKNDSDYLLALLLEKMKRFFFF